MCNKAGKGLYRREKKADGSSDKFVYNIAKGDYEPLGKISIPFKKDCVNAIQASDYKKLGQIIQTAQGTEADLLRHFIARYISYSFSLIPEVTDASGVDGSMGFGFNWVPPTAWVDVLGGVDQTRKFIDSQKIPVPDFLAKATGSSIYTLRGKLDYRQLFRAG